MANFRIMGAALGIGAVLTACSTGPDRLAPTAPVAPRQCGSVSFPIYFDKNADHLTASASAVLASGAAQVKGCVVSRVEVLGLADADGPTNHNLALSRRRADRVAEALAGLGLPAPVFDTEAIGAAGARAIDGKPEPLRRRTEVVIHAAPKSP
jgi:outer membrane protein OmpA-like peptidoglycan-associated protein